MPRGDVLDSLPGVSRLWRLSTRPVGSVRAVSTRSRSVVLTFDDGPVPTSTDSVLAALADAGATATFFVLMTRVRRSPRLLDEILAGGNEVALHGPDHRRLTALRAREVVDRTRSARLELEDRIGRPVRWVRPPYGSQSLRTWTALRRAGVTPVMWGGTTWDWKDIPTTERLERALSDVTPGQIVLAHDALAGPDDGAEPRPGFALDRGAFVRELLAGYAAMRYSAVSLADALAAGGNLQTWAWFGR